MKLEAQDIRDLRPVISAVVAEVLLEMRGEGATLNGCLAMDEAEAAAALGVQRHVLRDCRLRGELSASKIGKKIVYSRHELLEFLQRHRTN